MRKICLWLLALQLFFPYVHAQQEEYLSAKERIAFYHQDTSEASLAAYPYNAIYCKSASFTILGGNGCSLYAGLHAYQWLFGKFGSLEEQTHHAQEMVKLLQGKNPASQGNGYSAAFRYAQAQGARKDADIQETEKSIAQFFDEKKGALYINSSWPGGGHFFIAVGYTHHEINGKDTFLLHIVDSNWGATVSNFKAYDFETFARAEVKNNWNTAQEFWLPLQEGINILFGLWAPPEPETP